MPMGDGAHTAGVAWAGWAVLVLRVLGCNFHVMLATTHAAPPPSAETCGSEYGQTTLF